MYLSEANNTLELPPCNKVTEPDFLGFQDYLGDLGEAVLSLRFLSCETGMEQIRPA